MARRNWGRVRPRSQQEAMRLQLDYARERHNRSVAQVAERIGVSEFTLYGWMSEGSMPSRRIRPFEHACDPHEKRTFLTDYLCLSAQKLVVDIPSGSKVGPSDINNLQGGFADAVGLLLKFYDGGADAGETLAALERCIGDLAGHRLNVAKAQAPELGLFEGETE